ncbi:phage-like element PBSX protein XkdS [Bacillus sp. J14TS2]|uniref:DUF2634 domain-containing protein n=1 Tax=Bacillus sp. J14TS2 TaxID=2807188 RepID=UPI001B09B249|nr:DUF2634 domain-containing protein [Bacillus sp. J14TS2]GIN71123.1 phage-like element PBSX protein XkdS [Bacillus sp. J14TS2]
MLEPEIDFSEAEKSNEEDRMEEGYQTYKLDIDTGHISRELITGVEAVKQFIALAIRTPRFQYPIYSDQFGSEVWELIKSSDEDEVTLEFLRSEIERLTTEALIFDDRIEDVYEFEIQFKGDTAHVKFKVDSLGEIIEIDQEVVM